MFSLNLLNSMTKVFVTILKELEPATTCVRDKDTTTLPARHIFERQDH